MHLYVNSNQGRSLNSPREALLADSLFLRRCSVHDSLEIRKRLHVTGESKHLPVSSSPSPTVPNVDFYTVDQTLLHRRQSPFKVYIYTFPGSLLFLLELYNQSVVMDENGFGGFPPPCHTPL